MTGGAGLPHASPRRLPAAIGGYRVLDRIGKGAMGVVYSAADDGLGRQVAVKVMMADLEGDSETRERFYREAKVAGRLQHRNLIAVYDMGEEDGRLYMVMELLHGDTLNDYMKRVPAVPLETTLDCMGQMCEGLAVAHAHGIFHRDIKPGNIFIQADGSLKVLDFGVARLAGSNMNGRPSQSRSPRPTGPRGYLTGPCGARPLTGEEWEGIMKAALRLP